MIDAVITWVNGADPQHQEKRAKHLDQTVSPSSNEATRFDSLGEVRFAVLSLLRYCPFLRDIHVVTDAQHPDILNPILAAHSNIKIVDHVDIFGEHADLLPVFSSRSIETMVHRIPSLSEQFLYLNDDVFIGRPMTAEDYFDGEAPIIRGNFKAFPNPAFRKRCGVHTAIVLGSCLFRMMGVTHHLGCSLRIPNRSSVRGGAQFRSSRCL